MLRNRMQTRNYRFVWGILCSSCRCASSQWRHSWKIWIFALKPCLLFSTLLMTFADSHHWLHCQKKWDQKWWMRSTFFDNEDTLVRWVWRHWKSYHKHFFSKQKWIKCVYPDSFYVRYTDCKNSFLLGNAKSFNFAGRTVKFMFLVTNWFKLLKWHHIETKCNV